MGVDYHFHGVDSADKKAAPASPASAEAPNGMLALPLPVESVLTEPNGRAVVTSVNCADWLDDEPKAPGGLAMPDLSRLADTTSDKNAEVEMRGSGNAFEW